MVEGAPPDGDAGGDNVAAPLLGAKVRAGSDKEPGGATGGPIVAVPAGLSEGDKVSGGLLISAGPGNGIPDSGMVDNGAGLVAQDEHPPGAPQPLETPAPHEEQPP